MERAHESFDSIDLTHVVQTHPEIEQTERWRAGIMHEHAQVHNANPEGAGDPLHTHPPKKRLGVVL
jgi:hypothetical protein